MGTEQNFQFPKVQRLKDFKDRGLEDIMDRLMSAGKSSLILEFNTGL